MKILKFNEEVDLSWYTAKTVGQLKELLSKYDDDTEVMILDGFNGGGNPRSINSGPREYKITQEDIDEMGDCEHKEVGETVVLLGYGSY
jgi:hypothetical protein